MHLLRFKLYAAILLSGCLISSNLFACTNITVKATDGTVIAGRTMEFAQDLQSQLVMSPQGKMFITKSLKGQQGLKWHAKYGFIYANFFGINHVIDGMNEKGLSISGLYLPGYTTYQTVPKGKDAQALPYYMLGDWALSNFSSVAEVKAALQHVYIYAAPLTIGTHKNIIFPLHFIFTDKTGSSLVVEFVHGRVHFYDNKLGILTNSPTFDWQLTNLKNYANLTPYSPNTIQIDGYEYSGTGQGAGAIGLPGDYTPPSRFVKMSYLIQHATKAQNAAQALNSAQHILNNVDIVNGVVKGQKGVNALSDKTQWTIFKDLTDGVIYFKSYDNTTLQAINLNDIDFSNKDQKLSVPMNNKQIIIDITESYMEGKNSAETS